jgi:molecular chaperone DnaJ
LAKRDYYEVLGLDKDASQEDIKRAYRKVAVSNHPDRNPGDTEAEERFKEATEAYEILADQEKRQAYDQFGFAGVEGMSSAAGGGGGFSDFSSAFRDFEDIFGDFSGIFETFFGGGGGRRRGGRSSVQRGADLRYDLEVDFLDAAFGTELEISYRRHVACERCSGEGAEPGSSKKTCQTCGGAGQVRRSSGFFSIASACPTCGGEGSTLENPCNECGGSGLDKKKQSVQITIPAGIDTGKRINVPGQGDAGPNGGPAGDLFVIIHVKPHEYFERGGTDVQCTIPLTITQAALGAEVMVPTLEEKRVKMKIPAGTQSERVFRLKGEGVPQLNNPHKRGDMYVKVHVEVPNKLSNKAKELLKEYAELEGDNEKPDPLPASGRRA